MSEYAIPRISIDKSRESYELPVIKNESLLNKPKNPTGITEFDEFLEGGLPQGLNFVWGPEACGKSTLGWRITKSQAECGKNILYLPEDNIWVNRLENRLTKGDRDNVQLIQWNANKNNEKIPLTYESLMGIIQAWAQTSVGKIVVIDSIDPLITNTESVLRGYGEFDRGRSIPWFFRSLHNLSDEYALSIVAIARERIRQKANRQFVIEPSQGREMKNLGSEFIYIHSGKLIESVEEKNDKPYYKTYGPSRYANPLKPLDPLKGIRIKISQTSQINLSSNEKKKKKTKSANLFLPF